MSELKATPYDSSIKALKKHISERKETLAKLEVERAEYLCPFDKGETIELDSGVPFLINKILPDGGGCGFKLRGNKIKKSGELYTNEMLVHDFDFKNALAKTREE